MIGRLHRRSAVNAAAPRLVLLAYRPAFAILLLPHLRDRLPLQIAHTTSSGLALGGTRAARVLDAELVRSALSILNDVTDQRIEELINRPERPAGYTTAPALSTRPRSTMSRS